jgi:hypothetical protein
MELDDLDRRVSSSFKPKQAFIVTCQWPSPINAIIAVGELVLEINTQIA